ncbi:MAG: response regulator transcription factor [Ignavibacteriaceae bacterium]|jgi:DNA-binding response OmpR family regulator|nr:response regulator transcription factor [Ignavibacteriaceae bacterium]
MKILIIEDEIGIANFLRDGLEDENYSVDIAHDGLRGLELATNRIYDLILADWMLPGISGIDITKQIRKSNKKIPIIFLTAKDTVQDTVAGLEAGANDYIKKPFQFEELLARIKVQLRKEEEELTNLSFEDLTLDTTTHQVFRDGTEINLTKKEFSLLYFLLKNKGKVCTRNDIIKEVWEINFETDSSSLDVYINFLRKKLETKNGENIIQTIRGIGYIIRERE